MIVKAINVALLYLFIIWSIGLIIYGPMAYPGVYVLFFFQLVILYLINNLIALGLKKIQKRTFSTLHSRALAGLVIAVIMWVIWVKIHYN